MRIRRFGVLFVCIIGLIAALVACATESPAPPGGPVLVQQSTLEPTVFLPTRVIIPEDTATFAPNLEVISPLEIATVQADFVFVTPTTPPSKTPTTTPTVTPTITITPTPTLTVTATATRQLFPTSVIIPVEAPVAAPVDRICDSQWFFIEPRPAACPAAPPTASQGVYQTFENGHMIWFGALNVIYVMYNDGASPRWQVFRDFFTEDQPHESPDYANPPRSGVWQPRRGFGLLWRNNQAVRDRIGWGTIQWEMPYSLTAQQSNDGSLFLNDPSGRVFALFPGGSQWQLYAGFGN